MKILDRLEELEKEATKGPWKCFENDIGNSQSELIILAKTTSHWVNGYPVVEGPTDPGDASLIAESRNALPHLIKVARAATMYLKYLGDIEEFCHSNCDREVNGHEPECYIARAFQEHLADLEALDK